MTDTPGHYNGGIPSRFDRIEAMLERVAIQQATNTEAITDLSQEMRELTSNTDRVLARSAVLDDVLLELRDGHEQHQRNFERHLLNFEAHQRRSENNQQSINAALERLEAILLQFISPNN